MSARRWTPPLVWAAVILLVTSIPNPDVGTGGIPGADKLLHGVLYLVLGWLAAHASRRSSESTARAFVLLVVIALFAAVDEWHQRFIPGRGADIRDWGADVAGAIVGIAAARLRLSRREAAT